MNRDITTDSMDTEKKVRDYYMINASISDNLNEMNKLLIKPNLVKLIHNE